MKSLISFTLTFALFFQLSLPVHGQEPEKQLTIRERRETQKLITTFTERLEQSLDLEEAMRGLMMDHWMFHCLSNESTAEMILPSSFDRNLTFNDQADYQRFYVALLRFVWVRLIYCQTLPEDHDVEDCLPPDVLQAIKRDQRLTLLMIEQSEEFKIENAEQLREVTTAIEQLFLPMQRHVLKLKTEREDEYWKAISRIKRQSELKPSVESCEDEETCLGFSKEKRVFYFVLLPFYVVMTEVQGQMKIVAILPYMD